MGERIRQTQLEGMMTAREVAEFLGVSKSSMNRWTSSGALRSYRVGTRGDRRYRFEDVLSFMERSESREGRSGNSSNSAEVACQQSASGETATLSTLFDSAEEPVAVLDADLRLVGLNQSFAELLGRREAEVVGEGFHRFAPDLLSKSRRNDYLHLLSNGKRALMDELRLACDSGQRTLKICVVRLGGRLVVFTDTAQGCTG